MKYILKKDLPFAKAGEPVKESVNDRGVILIKNPHAVLSTGLGYREILLAEGWIEEVKPREFWIAEYHNYQGKVFYSEENAQNSSNNLKEVIKVREVID